MVTVFLTGAYSLYMYLGITHGKGGLMMVGCGVGVSDMILVMSHWLPLNLLFMVDMYCVISIELY